MRLSSWLRCARSLFVPAGTEKGLRPPRLRKRAPGAPLFGTPSLTLNRSLVVLNRADGGAAGDGGSAGSGEGGGLYLSPGGIVSAELASAILANHASTSDDNVFGSFP
jgi:hypothetical protein